MKTIQHHAPFTLLLALLTILIGAAAQPGQAEPAPGATFPRSPAGLTSSINRPLSPATSVEQVASFQPAAQAPARGRASGLAFPAPVAANTPLVEPGECGQVMVNSRLDVVDLGDGTGTVEPWVQVVREVYFSDVDFTSPQHSLLMTIAEDGDTELFFDGSDWDEFGQAFLMPHDLASIKVSYNIAAANTFTQDRAYGNLILLQSDGTLDKLLLWWEVDEFDNAAGTWITEIAPNNDPDQLALLEGKWLALTFNLESTDPASLGQGETRWFDDITLEVCRQPPQGSTVYLPAALKGFQTGPRRPTCIPPSENPQDEFNMNRGTVETGALCQSTLSRFDQKDYYTFKPTQGGQHTFHLTDLPSGTQWSLSLFVDKANPELAPGPVNIDGTCRIATPGSGDKSVNCNLTKNKAYFVKVSAGADYDGPTASYQMKITK